MTPLDPTHLWYDVWSRGGWPTRSVIIKITHAPTGTTATSDVHTSELAARREALNRLETALGAP